MLKMCSKRRTVAKSGYADVFKTPVLSCAPNHVNHIAFLRFAFGTRVVRIFFDSKT